MIGLIGRLIQIVSGKPREGPTAYDFTDSDIYSIENAWRDHFAPVVRELGFKGSGRHFRQISDEYVQTVNLQGSQYGGKFAVNLGLQPIDGPDEFGREIDPKTIKEINCIFRNRLTYDGCDTWWSYGDDVQSKREAANSAAKLFQEQALLHFQQRIAFAETVSPEDIGKTMPGIYVALALLRERQGRHKQAKQFAQMALSQGSSKYWKGYSPIKHLLRK